MRSLDILRSGERVSSVDVFRAFAILPVVVYHYHGLLPFGYLGVDLFFVISGLLVGSILVRELRSGNKINFWQFFLRRGFKIWPSYYWFLIAGNLLAYILYSESRPDYIIGGEGDILRYVLFYQNYTGQPHHWPFDHVWSLCAEEHFYILLPLLLIIIRQLFGNKRGMLLVSAGLLIVSGIAFKYISYHFTRSMDTFSGTHNRIDALGWGVLLGVLVTYFEQDLRRMKYRFIFFFAGLLLLAAAMITFIALDNAKYQKIAFHSIAPFCFFLMLLGMYYTDFSAWKPLRFIAYYSYNWYLWHPVFVLAFSSIFGITWWGLLLYMLISFMTAIVFTISVEEWFMGKRDAILAVLFKKKKGNIKSAA